MVVSIISITVRKFGTSTKNVFISFNCHINLNPFLISVLILLTPWFIRFFTFMHCGSLRGWMNSWHRRLSVGRWFVIQLTHYHLLTVSVCVGFSTCDISPILTVRVTVCMLYLVTSDIARLGGRQWKWTDRWSTDATVL